jgi:hypothetical protein
MKRRQFDNKLSLPIGRKRLTAVEDHNSEIRKGAKCRKHSRNDEVCCGGMVATSTTTSSGNLINETKSVRQQVELTNPYKRDMPL